MYTYSLPIPVSPPPLPLTLMSLLLLLIGRLSTGNKPTGVINLKETTKKKIEFHSILLLIFVPDCSPTLLLP